MDWIFWVFLGIAILMVGFWAFQFGWVQHHRLWSERPVKRLPAEESLALTWIHPIKDLDYKLRRSISSWVRQDFDGTIEHIFSFQDAADEAIPVVKAFLASRGIGAEGRVRARILVNPVLPKMNGKSSNMVHAVRVAAYDLLVFNDSDLRVKRDFLRKLAGPLADPKVGIVTCGQINFGGRDFWTRSFTCVQNHETDLYWAFFCWLGIDVGMTGAAFSMRRETLEEVGGLEAFGASLLEDMHIGNELYKRKYKLVVGPYLDCHVKQIAREKTFNYAKRIAVGIRAHLATDMPFFLLVIGWYWWLLVAALLLGARPDLMLIVAACFFLRIVHGNVMRLVTKNDIVWYDLLNGLYFDVLAICALFYGTFARPTVSWRGIRYRVTPKGYIDFDNPIAVPAGPGTPPPDIDQADLNDNVEVVPDHGTEIPPDDEKEG